MKAVLVHGLAGAPDNHWFPWLRRELKKRGIPSKAPKLPHPFLPVRDEWVAELRNAIEDPEQTVLIGHSLGCPTILYYLEKYRGKKKFPVVVLVAGFGRQFLNEKVEKLQARLLRWHNKPLDFGKIRPKCKKFVCINSTDDLLVPYSEGEWLAKKLNAELVPEKKRHFVAVAGHGTVELPSALDAVICNIKPK
ncbi:serine hydrolase family protein [Candidatus Uhrbacteria bacterium]|nr:serine hydrolase family protein [Candidatus Uhrbacteria bacterium]